MRLMLSTLVLCGGFYASRTNFHLFIHASYIIIMYTDDSLYIKKKKKKKKKERKKLIHQ